MNLFIWNDEVSNTAKRHSQDMARYGYQDHIDSKGKDPRDRLLEDGVNFKRVGENVAAGAPTAIDVHHIWIESLGHRENVLSYELGDLGVGMAISHENKDFDIPYWTQVFIAKD